MTGARDQIGERLDIWLRGHGWRRAAGCDWPDPTSMPATIELVLERNEHGQRIDHDEDIFVDVGLTYHLGHEPYRRRSQGAVPFRKGVGDARRRTP